MPLLSSLRVLAALTAGVGSAAGQAPVGNRPALVRAAPSPSNLEKQAAAAREAGRLDEAERLYREALAKRPSWLEGRWALGTLLYDRDRLKGARVEFDHLSKARPADMQALAFRALCDARLGAEEAALRDLLRVRKKGVPYRELASVVDFQAATLLNRRGDPDGAFEVLRKFALDSDDRPAVLESFGLVVLRMALLPAEIPAAKRDMILLAGRGGYHLARSGRNEVGRMAMEELVSRYPSEPNVHYALGMYLQQEDPVRAIEEFQREITVSPDHSVAMIQIALTELRRGRAQAALPVAEKAAELTPNVPAARMVLGRALLALGQTDRAIGEMEVAVKLAPEVARLHYSLAQAYQQADRSEDAARERREFQKLNKTSGAEPGGEPGFEP